MFVRIKNWNSCVPEEVRKKSEFMPIYNFERTVFPRRFGSPFLPGSKAKATNKNVRFPGGIGESVEKEKGEGTGSERRNRSRRTGTGTGGTGGSGTPRGGGTNDVGPSRGLFVGNAAPVASPATMTPYYSAAAAATPQIPYQQFSVPLSRPQSTQQQQQRPVHDRTILSRIGGPGALAQGVKMEKLPEEIGKKTPFIYISFVLE